MVYEKLQALQKLEAGAHLDAKWAQRQCAVLMDKLTKAEYAARVLVQSLPPPSALGLDTYAVQRGWLQAIRTIQASVSKNTPRPIGGRPAKWSNKALAIGILGGLARGSVPSHKQASAARGCLEAIGVQCGSAERAVANAKRAMKALGQNPPENS